MTDLAFNLCDTSLSSGTPNLIIKKKLTMDYESSPSPSSSHDHSSDSGTPLAAITNKPKVKYNISLCIVLTLTFRGGLGLVLLSAAPPLLRTSRSQTKKTFL